MNRRDRPRRRESPKIENEDENFISRDFNRCWRNYGLPTKTWGIR